MARGLVAGSSAAVLVLEILAGRLLAPYVGVSLETFTGIIGVVLAGIAAGAWAGGIIADHRDARDLIGPSLLIGGVLAWLVLPILGALGNQFGSGGLAIILLSTCALFLPSAVLSAVSPMVAKLRLRSLGETGSVVGGLSAAGTLGALAGTFITGFVLVQALPTRLTVIVLGAVLVVAGIAVHAYLRKALPPTTALVIVLLGGLLGITSDRPCQTETAYFCANVVVDPDNPDGRSLYLDALRHAYVDLEDPTVLDIRYIRLFAQVTDSISGPDNAPLDTLHIGGGGFSFPRYLEHVRPGSTEVVVEIDAPLVDLVASEFDITESDTMRIEVGDARRVVGELDDSAFSIAYGDAFASKSVPWHLTTREFIEDIERVLTDDGVYVMNVIDGRSFDFARAELATLRQVFDHVVAILPAEGLNNRSSLNLVLVASNAPLPTLAIDAADGEVLSEDETIVFIDRATPLRDDYAPVDQLLN